MIHSVQHKEVKSRKPDCLSGTCSNTPRSRTRIDGLLARRQEAASGMAN